MSQLIQISGCANSDRKADVVFIHGLGGDALETWRSGEGDSTSWPHWLGREFPDVGIWSLSYAASPTRWAGLLQLIGRGSRDSGHDMALPDRALQVLDLMTQTGLGKRPLLFICHSLGGLLAKQIIRKSYDNPDPQMSQVACQTRAVLFLATPHNGVVLASLLNAFGGFLGATPSIEDLCQHNPNLRDLFDWYRTYALQSSVQTVTYYETRSVNGMLPIVNPTTAHPGVGQSPVALDEDHLSIAKPRDCSAQVYGAARNLLQYVVASRLNAPSSVCQESNHLYRELEHRFQLTHQNLVDPDPLGTPNASRLLALTVALDPFCAYGTNLFGEFENLTVRQIIAAWEEKFPDVLRPVNALLNDLECVDREWRRVFDKPNALDLITKMVDLVEEAKRRLTTALRAVADAGRT